MLSCIKFVEDMGEKKNDGNVLSDFGCGALILGVALLIAACIFVGKNAETAAFLLMAGGGVLALSFILFPVFNGKTSGPAQKSSAAGGNNNVVLSFRSYPVFSVTSSYFDDIVLACRAIKDFGEKLAEDTSYVKAFESVVSADISSNGRAVDDFGEKIRLTLFYDALRCHQGFGYKVEIGKRESLGIFIFALMMFDRGCLLRYEDLDRYCADKGDTVSKIVKSVLESSEDNPEIFIHEHVLGGFSVDLHNQYVMLLYRFASLIAKADHEITPEEVRWLNRIVELKSDSKGSLGDRGYSSFAGNALQELESLVGLESVKQEVTSLANYIKVQKMRQENGMKAIPVSYHCVFTGNPGTGKTTVARILSGIYKDLGVLKKGTLVETDRSGLVAEYVGQTAVKTNKIIDSALDGILFIDEAYSLADGGSQDYGKEAIATLLKRMEDDRDRLIVILAGYTDQIKHFIDSNPGLQSRFNRYIEFPDYSAEELFQIFLSRARKYDYKLSEPAVSTLKQVLADAVSHKDRNFGNGRFARNLFEKVIEKQAGRLLSTTNVSSESLSTIEPDDIVKSV